MLCVPIFHIILTATSVTQGPTPPWQNAHQFHYFQSNLLHPLIYASVYELVFFSLLPISFHREGAWSSASINLHLCSFDF